MANSPQRHHRLRLARQRPAPDRVRGRIREDGEPPARRWWSGIDWAKWGTAVGIVAGIGTLLFTGIATYYAARVSQDQLQQSQEDADREARDQAAHLAFWIGSV